MMTATELADAIGRKKMQDALNVGATAVSNAVIRGWFPTRWFMVMSALAEEVGAECPPHLFGMKQRLNPQIMDSEYDCKAGGEL